MSKQIYNWKRFWCPRSGNINLADGYLSDPDAEYGKILNPDLVDLEAIADVPCLVLLGEPGIGKSQELESFKTLTESNIGEADQVFELNLRSCTSLRDDLFREDTFITWLNGTHDLFLFLDSLDEGLLSIRTLATGLTDELKKSKYKNQINRLYLRLACRTFVFPSILEKELPELWGKDKVGIYELAPLRRMDIVEAAEKEGFVADDFLNAIHQRDIIPFVIKPITLRFLLNTYRRHDDQFLPEQKLHEFYLEGCKLLCEEINENRRSSNFIGSLDSDQRLIVAARIAAIMIFSNRVAVWTEVDQGNVPTEDLLLQRFCHGHEYANGRQFEITREVIQEILDTGLFSSRGSNRMGWTHQTYAEFLAAWYLTHHEIPLSQIKNLIFSSEDSDQKVIPQLSETVAWLASMRLDVLTEVIATDPDIVLHSDIPTDEDVRFSIVDSLLTQFQEGKLFEEYKNYRKYVKLKHPKLPEQLCNYICDASKRIEARDLAIDLAETCEVYELQDELANIALDTSQLVRLRASAARAVSLIGDTETRQLLKPLATQEVLEDKEDQIKGYAIQAIWSEHLSATELFQVLTPPKKANFFGGYQSFLDLVLIKKLQKKDLLIALNWLKIQGIRCFGQPFRQLGDQILFKAWENFDLPEIVEAFANLALLQWKEYQRIITSDEKLQNKFSLSIENDSSRRHMLLEQIVLMLSETNDKPTFLLSSSHENILISEDVFWMIEKLQSSNHENAQKTWSQLIQWTFNRQEVQQIDAILIASQNNQILQGFFAPYFEAIELNSTQAEKLKSDYLKMQEMEDNRKNVCLVDPPPKIRVLQQLEQFEAGNLSAWWQLNRQMQLKPNSKHYNHEFKLDLSQLPGWKGAEKNTQSRIIGAAKKYVCDQNNISYDWIGKDSYNQATFSGAKALFLLLKEDPSFLDTLSNKIWGKWTPAIVAAPVGSAYDNDKFYLKLVNYAYQNEPKESIEILEKLIDVENSRSQYIFVIERFEECWDERLKRAILEKAQDSTLYPKCVGQLLSKLAQKGSTEAIELAQSLIYHPLPNDLQEWQIKNILLTIILVKNLQCSKYLFFKVLLQKISNVSKKRETTLVASKVLIENSDQSSWEYLWSFTQQDSSFGRAIFEFVCDFRPNGIQLNLAETQLADLYIWLVRQYPYEEDRDYAQEEDEFTITARDEIARLRDSVLSQLREQGTTQACSEVQRLIEEFPNLSWLTRILSRAKANMRRKTWQPVTSEEFLQLILNRDKRLVQNGQQLLDVLIESLERLELELQGETPAARDIWDKIGENTFKPLDENAFSDYVKRFFDRDLKERGIIVNREVELRSNYGGNPGERTDIHVDAVLKHQNNQGYDSLTVIIEVKGCWHKEVQTAMEAQLVQRYLANNNCPYGLYLVGWFNCQQWDNQDYRKKRVPKIILDEARKQFNEQAKNLSSPGTVVRSYVLNTALR